jgi:hypothetical protein
MPRWKSSPQEEQAVPFFEALFFSPQWEVKKGETRAQ